VVLAEIRELNNVNIRIITNPRHSIRPFCVEPKKTDEYVYRPTTHTPLFVRASESFRNLHIDPRKIEKTPQHIRPPWINITNQQYDFEVCNIGRGASNETARILEERYKHHTKIYTDGSKKEERVGYAVIWNHQKITRSAATKHNLQRRTISNHNSHSLHNERTGEKSSLEQEGYKKTRKRKITRGRLDNTTLCP
jgi:hypothetical protein